MNCWNNSRRFTQKESFENETALINFCLKHKDKLSWYPNVQKLLFNYFHAEVKLLGFSQLFKPLLHCLFLQWSDNFDHSVAIQLQTFRHEYSRLFGMELESEEGLLMVFYVLFDESSSGHLHQAHATTAIRSKWPSSVELRVVGMPVINQVTESTITKQFNFHKHTFIKNRIQFYFIGGNQQVSSVHPVEQRQDVNLADVDVFRKTLRESIYNHFVPHFECRLNSLLSKHSEYRNSKKKNLWSFFTGDGGRTKANGNEITPHERNQFNIAELYLMIGNYEAAGNEFKALVQLFAVR